MTKQNHIAYPTCYFLLLMSNHFNKQTYVTIEAHTKKQKSLARKTKFIPRIVVFHIALIHLASNKDEDSSEHQAILFFPQNQEF